MKAKFITEIFREESDPIEDMKIGKSRWFSKVRDFFNKEVFGNENYTDLFIDIAKEKLEKLYQQEADPEDAADICYNDITLFNEWQKESGTEYDSIDPYDDLKTNFRSYEGFDNEEYANELTTILVNRHPSYSEAELQEMAYDWCSYDPNENEEDIDESYILRPLEEKFKEVSDPIEDLGIGPINIYRKAQDIIEDNGIDEWITYMKSLYGKTIKGYFIRNLFDKEIKKEFYIEFKIQSCNSAQRSSIIWFTDEKNKNYMAIKNKKYIII